MTTGQRLMQAGVGDEDRRTRHRLAQDREELGRLTRRDATGRVTRWGLQVPSTGYPYWLFQGFTTQNDVLLMNGSGTQNCGRRLTWPVCRFSSGTSLRWPVAGSRATNSTRGAFGW